MEHDYLAAIIVVTSIVIAAIAFQILSYAYYRHRNEAWTLQPWIPSLILCVSFFSNEVILTVFGEPRGRDGESEMTMSLSSMTILFMLVVVKASAEFGSRSASPVNWNTTAITLTMLIFVSYFYACNVMATGSSRSKVLARSDGVIQLPMRNFNLWAHTSACQVALYGFMAAKIDIGDMLSIMGVALLTFAVWLSAEVMTQCETPDQTLSLAQLYFVSAIFGIQVLLFFCKALRLCFEPFRAAGAQASHSTSWMGWTMSALVALSWALLPATAFAAKFGLVSAQSFNLFLTIFEVFICTAISLMVQSSSLLWRERITRIELAQALTRSRLVAQNMEQFLRFLQTLLPEQAAAPDTRQHLAFTDNVSYPY